MKKIFTLLFAFICLQSCIVYVNDPDYHRPPQGHPGGQCWWTDNNGGSCNGGCEDENCPTCGGSKRKNTTNPQGDVENDTVPLDEFVPIVRYDSCTVNGTLTFNVYLGWNVDQMNTIIMLKNWPVDGGEIIFNIYTNNMYMSMYGFEKYRKDFYWFSEDDVYCGYSSYSLDTKGIARYKMNITRNDTGYERSCYGYWACNNGSNFYSSFKVYLFQCF